jgi:ring-1,2-phenylacetyl-CoA epoxidase subunit PaaC
MQASIEIAQDAPLQYLLRIGDTALILGQRLGEWTGHAPVLEEDIALANMALDLIGQARAVLSHAGAVEGRGHDDFALAVLRNTMAATFFHLLWTRLQDSTDAELAAIAGKAVKEARYHQQHAADWVVRLGDGTAESRRRMVAALERLWPYAAELFADDAVDEAAAASGLGPRWSALRPDWEAAMAEVLAEASLPVPAHTAFVSTGKRGVHSEHMGYILAEMQQLQRAYPGGVW